jgi:flagellar FliJ protein
MFKFPLQRLLEIRTRREEEVARQLAQARSAVDQSRATRDALAAAHAVGQEQLTEAKDASATVGELRSLSYVLTQLNERIAAAAEEVRVAEAHVGEVSEALTTAVQERRVLDKLRDRMLEAYRTTQSQKDRTTMDAIALSRYTRGNDASPPASGDNE